MIYFIRSKLPSRNSHRLWSIVFIILITSFLSIYTFVEIPIPDTFVFLFPFLYAFLALDGKWYIKAMWSATLAVVFLAVTEFGLNLSIWCQFEKSQRHANHDVRKALHIL